MKVAIVHYWLVGMRGGEKVVESLCDLYPDADIYTHVVDPSKLTKKILKHKIITTWVAKLPFARRWYTNYLVFMPMALEQLDLSDYDLVISSESGPAKGVILSPKTKHICYCHTPMRYVWDMYFEYLNSQNFLKKFFMRPMLHYIRMWDFQTAARVDYFIANSQFVANRIRKIYRRDATVIHPPVSTNRFNQLNCLPLLQRDDYYVFFGQLVSYKRADIAVKAFNQLGKKLVVIGDGPEMGKLKNIAQDNIVFTGRLSDDDVEKHLSSCRGLIFPGTEDFGIVPVEAMAAGTPVVAYAEGGALETVVDGKTGVFFTEQSWQSLCRGIDKLEKNLASFSVEKNRHHAEGFTEKRFKDQFITFLANTPD